MTGPGLDSEHIVFPVIQPASLSGMVMDSDGEPVPQAQVMLLRQVFWNGFPQFFQFRVNTNSQSGAFRFSHLPPGRYYIVVQGQPWYAQHPNLIYGANGATSESRVPPELDVAYPITYSGDTTDPAGAQPIQLNEGALVESRITLHPVPAVSLTVKTPDEEQQGINASLLARDLGGMSLQSSQGMMGIPGGAQISGIAPGRYELVWNGGSGRIRRTIDLTANTTIELTKEDPVQDTGHLTFDPPGSGRAQLMLLLESQGAVYAGRPSANGALLFDSVPSGRYQVLLNAPGFYIKSIVFNGAKVAGDFIDVPSSGGFDLSVVAARTAVDKVEGVVEHEGKPVAAAVVLLLPEDVSRTSLIRRDQSDSDGSFSLGDVAPGRYKLVAIEGEPELAYRDPAVIKPYLAKGKVVDVGPGFAEKVKVELSR